MKRQVDIIQYLPEFIREYNEIKRLTNAENPEFQFAVNTAENIKNNMFIEDCDEKGIERFEKLTGIIPDPLDSLDVRKKRVMTHWNDITPYTLKVLINRLNALYGTGNFKLSLDADKYFLSLVVCLDLLEQTKVLEDMLDNMLPANIALSLKTFIQRDVNSAPRIAGTVTACRRHTINSERITI